MAYFAKLDENNRVLAVISVSNNEIVDENGIEQEEIGIEWCKKWSDGWQNWKQTSFNARIRKKYAGIGFTYDEIRDAFIPPKPFASWILDEELLEWKTPKPMPEPIDGKIWVWDEMTISWKAIEAKEIE